VTTTPTTANGAVIVLNEAECVLLHDILTMVWYPVEHPYADKEDIAFIDRLQTALSASIPSVKGPPAP
jgi:hypothetical protein